MYIELSKSEFRDAFALAGRKNQFSYEALGALYDYCQEVEYSSGCPVMFDIGELCEWVEYDNLEAAKAEIDEIKDLEDLKDKAEVIEVPPKLSFDVNGNKIYSGGRLLVREF